MTTLKKFNKSFYSFSYALIPDDLQAQQLVIDGVSALTLVCRESGHEQFEQEEKFRFFMFAQIFKIALRRAAQIQAAHLCDNSSLSFYKLDLPTRAILSLYYKETLLIEEIALICEIEEERVIPVLTLGRRKLQGEENSFALLEGHH